MSNGRLEPLPPERARWAPGPVVTVFAGAGAPFVPAPTLATFQARRKLVLLAPSPRPSSRRTPRRQLGTAPRLSIKVGVRATNDTQ